MKIGLCTISDRERNVLELLRIAADCGFDGVEIWGKPPHVPEPTVDRAKEIRSIANDVCIDVLTYGSYLRAGTDRFEGRLHSELDFADHLGATTFRVWAGDEEYRNSSEERWRSAVEDLDTLATRARKRGLQITVERHRHSLTHETEGAMKLIESVDSDDCQLNWQANVHIHHSAEEIYADARSLALLTNNIHVQAWSRPNPVIAPENRCYVEDAFYDWDRLLSIFVEAGFEGNVDLEFTTEESAYENALRTDQSYLRRVVDGLDSSRG